MGELTQSPCQDVVVRTFYQFKHLPEPSLVTVQTKLREAGLKSNILGCILLSSEGCNANISGTAKELEDFFQLVLELFPDIEYQDSFADASPFNRFKVPLKSQIVHARDPELVPEKNFTGQKTPEQWNEVRELVQSGSAQMIDVRNAYEIAIGTFPEAIDPDTNTFKEFSDYLDREVGKSLDPSKPTAIYCTGGIRCEKARIDLERHGFSEVWQLKGGILTYLKDSSVRGFNGECFVFDDRVAVTQELAPTSVYVICPRCGGPTEPDDPNHDCQTGRVKP